MNGFISFERLVDLVSAQLPIEQSRAAIVDALTLEDGIYESINNNGGGVRLQIHTVSFSGEKPNGAPFEYKRGLFSGVNLWVADNLRGKTTIFQILTFALTGRNGLDPGIDDWWRKIELIFTVGGQGYMINIFRQKPSARAKFIHRTVDLDESGQIQPLVRDLIPLFEGGIGDYEEYIEEFFFNMFSMYAMQWTQKDSRKGSLGLNTSNAGWVTCFSTVFLDAKSYDKLYFGGQGELVLQMMLGLDLTLPINRLKVKADKLTNELARLKDVYNLVTDSALLATKNSQTELLAIDKKIAELTAVLTAPVTSTSQTAASRLVVIQKDLVSLNEQWNYFVDRIRLEIINKEELKDRLFRQKNKLDSASGALKKTDYSIASIREELSYGKFFNAIEVKYCPSCNHSVSNTRIKEEKEKGHCRLCDSNLKEHQEDIEIDYDLRLNELLKQRQYEYDQFYASEVELTRLNDALAKKEETLTTYNSEKVRIEQSISQLRNEFQILNKVVEDGANDFKPKVDIQSILAELSLLAVRKSELSKNSVDTTQLSDVLNRQKDLQNAIDIISLAQDILSSQRTLAAEPILRQLEQYYLQHLHDFGLHNYESVTIKPSFKISYRKHGGDYEFDSLSPGEKLRAKIGLYIALIELDMKHQFGHHPRFIILDSPASEEGDATYVDGLIQTLQHLEAQFGDKIQVFVGTAKRELAVTVSQEKAEVYPEKEFVF